jgi:hypothetical protein
MDSTLVREHAPLLHCACAGQHKELNAGGGQGPQLAIHQTGSSQCPGVQLTEDLSDHIVRQQLQPANTKR